MAGYGYQTPGQGLLSGAATGMALGGPGAAITGGVSGLARGLHQRNKRNRVTIPGLPSYGNTAEEEAQNRMGPILAALARRQAYEQPGVIRSAFAPFADRGMGISGVAQRGVGDALAKFQADYETQRQQLTRQGLQDVQQERYQANQLALQQQQTAMTREAARPWWSRL